jgi:hypothetical protein
MQRSPGGVPEDLGGRSAQALVQRDDHVQREQREDRRQPGPVPGVAAAGAPHQRSQQHGDQRAAHQ